MKIITRQDFQEKNYSLEFIDLIHDKTEHGEYLALIFKPKDTSVNALIILTPTSNYNFFHKTYTELVGDNYQSLTIHEAKEVLGKQNYTGNVFVKNNVVMVKDIKVLP